MLSHEENELLCRVEGAAPMGQMMRRYWLPVALSSDVRAGGAPKQIKVLGERLVVFRDSSGDVGVLDEFCPHRGASLVLARNENGALQCIYHGWRVDRNGSLLETPTELEDSTFAQRVRHVAYTTREIGGVVWSYLGQPGTEPAFPAFDWTTLDEDHRMVMRGRVECNWVQALEGAIDSAHSNYLHSEEIVPSSTVNVSRPVGSTVARPSADRRPKLEAENTVYGFRYAAIRRPLADPDKCKYIRTTLFVAPFHVFIPSPGEWAYMQSFVPIDDTHTMFYFIKARIDGVALDDETRAAALRRAGLRQAVDMDEDLNKVRNAGNLWLQDREAMESGRSFSGIVGVNLQDAAVQESMGGICDRTREHLGQTDVAVIRMRRLMLASVRDFIGGGVPLGLREAFPYGKLAAEERVIDINAPWQMVGARAGEYQPI
jgi:phthalate 4,5-dioxygenase oxygenase subunit